MRQSGSDVASRKQSCFLPEMRLVPGDGCLPTDSCHPFAVVQVVNVFANVWCDSRLINQKSSILQPKFLGGFSTPKNFSDTHIPLTRKLRSNDIARVQPPNCIAKNIFLTCSNVIEFSVVFPPTMWPVAYIEIPKAVVVIESHDFLMQRLLRAKFIYESSADAIGQRVSELPNQGGLNNKCLFFREVPRQYSYYRL